jgi:fused signal recognition particle receptor
VVTWIDALARTRRNIAGVLARFVKPDGRRDEATLEEMEETLLRADVPALLVSQLIRELDKAYDGLRVSKQSMLQKVLVESLRAPGVFSWPSDKKPLSILVVGVNGSGKTTTCAKLAHAAIQQGRQPLLAATDTFRAAGADQLKLWAKDVGCDVVAGAPGADAAAVAYDALDAAVSRERDLVIVDTAGRMHTKEPLMKELRKVRGAMAKRVGGAPHETWIVLDATLGQNAVVQAKVFHEAVTLTGVIVSKLDGSSKAGFVFSIGREMGIPVRFAGLGEKMDELVPFEPEKFVGALLSNELPSSNA